MSIYNGKGRAHFVGIGGRGMSALASFLLTRGWRVTGSDQSENDHTRRLRPLIQSLAVGKHSAENLPDDVDIVIYSSAVDASANIEVKKARKLEIQTMLRGELLADVFNHSEKDKIAVAGSHGKGTTVAMLVFILRAAERDPSFLAGVQIPNRNKQDKNNFCLESGTELVVETDESDGSFLLLRPKIGIITNIDDDHLGNYNDKFSELRDAFETFLDLCQISVICSDDPSLQIMASKRTSNCLTFGFGSESQIRARNVHKSSLTSSFNLDAKEKFGMDFEVKLSIPGDHNVLNALGAAAAALVLGIAPKDIRNGLHNFQFLERRFEILEGVMLSQGMVTVVSDYGHHPSEIRACLSTARSCFPTGKLITVFQPRGWYRVSTLCERFAKELSICDVLVLLPMYPDKSVGGVSSSLIADAVQGSLVRMVGSWEEALDTVQVLATTEDLVVVQGCPDDLSHLTNKFKSLIVNK